MTNVAESDFPESYTVVHEIEINGACLNCQAQLNGPFCARCGQRDLPAEPPLRELIAEAWDTFVSVDGKVAMTLRLLVSRPGALTKEYLTGRRARFLPPLRLYLICSLVYFLISAAAPALKPKNVTLKTGNEKVTLTAQTKRQPLDSAALAAKIDSASRKYTNWFSRRMKINSIRVGNDGHNFTSEFNAQMPRLLFVLMPLFAGLLALVYRSRHRRYAAHLIVSLHLHAFFFSAFAIAIAARWLPDRLGAKFVTPLITLWMLAYVPLALRRVYGGRVMPAILRTAFLFMSYSVVTLAAFAVVAVLLLFTY
jgi:hypothetical protein